MTMARLDYSRSQRLHGRPHWLELCERHGWTLGGSFCSSGCKGEAKQSWSWLVLTKWRQKKEAHKFTSCMVWQQMQRNTHIYTSYATCSELSRAATPFLRWARMQEMSWPEDTVPLLLTRHPINHTRLSTRCLLRAEEREGPEIWQLSIYSNSINI